jgi:hypothetical protein
MFHVKPIRTCLRVKHCEIMSKQMHSIEGDVTSDLVGGWEATSLRIGGPTPGPPTNT